MQMVRALKHSSTKLAMKKKMLEELKENYRGSWANGRILRDSLPHNYCLFSCMRLVYQFVVMWKINWSRQSMNHTRRVIRLICMQIKQVNNK